MRMGAAYCVIIYKVNKGLAYKTISTHWVKFFHRYRDVMEETFVNGPEASLSEPAATFRHGAVVKVASNPHKVTVQETGET